MVEKWNEKMILKLEKLDVSKMMSILKDQDTYLENMFSNMKVFQNLKKAFEEFNSNLFLRSLIKLGNSLAITLPRDITNELKLKAGGSVLIHYKKGLCFLYLGNGSCESLEIEKNHSDISFEEEKEETQLEKIHSYLEDVKIANVPTISNMTGVNKSNVSVYLSKNKNLFHSPKRGIWCIKDYNPTEEDINFFLSKIKKSKGSE